MSSIMKNAINLTYRNYWQLSKRLTHNAPQIPDVPGLSSKIVNVPADEVGPGASKDGIYKNPEYFCYDNVSFFEAEIEMKKFRLPQPSNKKPIEK